MISRATLHNEDYVKEKDILIGDTVVVERAGDVIPQVVKAIEEERDGTERVFTMPKRCPVCDEPVSRPEGEAVTRCVNASCPAQALEHIIHWSSKSAMDIDGLGEKLATRLFDLGFIKDAADVYDLKPDQLIPLEGFGEKSAENLIGGIQKSKEKPFSSVLYALGIRHVGSVTADLISTRFGGEDLMRGVDVEQLTGINGVGEVVARAVVEYFSLDDNRDLVRRLMERGLDFDRVEGSPSEGPLAGKRVVITGTLDRPRSYYVERLEAAGGTFTSSVSKNTDYVLAGEEAGSKLEKAGNSASPSSTATGSKSCALPEEAFSRRLSAVSFSGSSSSCACALTAVRGNPGGARRRGVSFLAPCPIRRGGTEVAPGLLSGQSAMRVLSAGIIG